MSLVVLLFAGPQLITTASSWVVRALTAPTSSATTAGSAKSGEGPAFTASDHLPFAVPGGACPSKKAQGRYPIGNQLLLCLRNDDRDLVWQYADPWLRLPVAIKGTTCAHSDGHARSFIGSTTALVCDRSDDGDGTWAPDPGWTPEP